ncbi:MAG: hypothetical protein AAGI25_13570 [Bacteroidota bacterium]
MEYITYNRLVSGESRFLFDEKGDMYVPPHWRFGWAEPYYNVNESELLSPFTILKFNEDGSFDPDFSFDLSETLSISFISQIGFVFDNKIQVIYPDDSYEFLKDLITGMRFSLRGISSR